MKDDEDAYELPTWVDFSCGIFFQQGKGKHEDNACEMKMWAGQDCEMKWWWHLGSFLFFKL